MSEGFIMDAGTAMLFFRVCCRYKLETLEDKMSVLRRLVKRKEVRYLRDVAPIVAGKKILKVGFKNEKAHNSGPEHFCPECGPKETH